VGWLSEDEHGSDPLRERNAAELARFVFDCIVENATTGHRIEVTPGLLCQLNRLAVGGELDDSGEFRKRDVEIVGAKHRPPTFEGVPALVDECCAYLNRDGSSLHLAAYALWRVGWIHPFSDGNGRAARAICYLVFCCREQLVPPGRGATLPERIHQRWRAYQRLLDEADLAFRKSRKVALTNLEGFLAGLIRAELEGR
jgi:Fic family protein